MRTDKGKPRRYKAGISAKYRSYLMKCNRYGLTAYLSEDEVNHITSLSCYYCGGSSRIGMTRITFDDDLIIDNVRPCCAQCNTMKSFSNEESFLHHIQRILKYQTSLHG